MSKSMSVRAAISAAITEMREEGKSQITVEVGKVAANTLRNYLWGHQQSGEVFDYSKQEDGSVIITREVSNKPGVGKSQLLDMLKGMRHCDTKVIRVEDLAVGVQYAKNVISNVSGNGVDAADYVKKHIGDCLCITCFNFKEAATAIEYDDEFETARNWQPEPTSVAFKPQPKPIDDDPDVDWRGQGEDDDEGPII